VLPNFLVDEKTVRESGEGAVFDIGQYSHQSLLLTFGITHAVEQQLIQLRIHGSEDGERWLAKPLLCFSPKFYCGEYQMTLHATTAQYLKAAWRVERWARTEQRPFFRFYLFAAVAQTHAAAAA
jgi:hypothetical protein